jgi:hypothetical protein
MKELQHEVGRADRELWLARMKTDVLQIMERAQLTESIPMEHIFPSVQDGVDAYLTKFGEASDDQ